MAQHKVADLLTPRGRPRSPLERLVKHASARDAWTAELRAVLPPALAPHCHVGDLHRGQLTIHVATASWATRLRLELPKVRDALLALADFADVRDIRIRMSAGGDAGA